MTPASGSADGDGAFAGAGDACGGAVAEGGAVAGVTGAGGASNGIGAEYFVPAGSSWGFCESATG